MTREIKNPAVKEQVDDWLGEGEYTVVQDWEGGYGTHYVVAHAPRRDKIYCLRLFVIDSATGRYALSVDQEYAVKMHPLSPGQ